MDSEARSDCGSSPSGNCADCGAPLVQYPDTEVGRGGGEEGRGRENQVIDAPLHHRPVWISKNPPYQINEPVFAWNRNIDAATDGGQTSSRSKSLDRTFCVRTTASPSPRRVIRHKTPPPFQLHKALSSSSAASPAAPRWDGISVWIPNTDLCRAKMRTANDCDPHTGATSSLKKTSSFRSRGCRSDNTEPTSPGVSRRLGPAKEERRGSNSFDNCLTQGHLQSAGDRRTGFSIFGRDAPELQQHLKGSSTISRKHEDREPSSDPNDFGRILPSPDNSLLRWHSARRSDESATPPKRLDSIRPPPPPPPVSSTIRSEQLDRFLGNVLPSRSKTSQSSTLNRPPSQGEPTSNHGTPSFPLADLRRFPSSDVRTVVEGRQSSGAAAPATASYSTVSGFVGSLPRRVVGIGSAAEEVFSPEDVLNWKLSLMDSDAVRLSPGSDDCDDSSGGGCSSPTRTVGSIGSGGPSETTTTAAFSFEETLEEVLEEIRRPTDDDEDDDEADEGSSFDEKDPPTRCGSSIAKSDRKNLESSLDVFEKHLDRLLSQTLDSADPISALMTSLELYRDRMIGRRASRERPTVHQSTSPPGGDTHKQFLSLTAGVECIHSDANLPVEHSQTITSAPADPCVDDQLKPTTTNRQGLVKHQRQSKAKADRGSLLKEQREDGLFREQREYVSGDRRSHETPAGGSNAAVHFRDFNGANISGHMMDLTSELEVSTKDKKNYGDRKTTSERDSSNLHPREFLSVTERDLTLPTLLQASVPGADGSIAEPSDAETRRTSEDIRMTCQQKNWNGRKSEITEAFPGIPSLSRVETDDAYPVQSIPRDSLICCPSRSRSKPFHRRSAEGIQTNPDDNDGLIQCARLEAPQAFIAQDNGDSDGYLSWSVPRPTGCGRSLDTASHGRSVSVGLGRRGLAGFDDGRTNVCLDPSGDRGGDRNPAQPDSNRPRQRGHCAGCSIRLPSSAADTTRSDNDVDDGGGGGGGGSWGGCVPYATRPSGQNRNAADVAASGTMPKSTADQGIDLLTCRRAPEESGRRTNGDEEEAASGNKIAFDEVSRRVSSDAENETPLLPLRQQTAELPPLPPLASAVLDDGRHAPQWQHSNHVSCCNCVSHEMPPRMVAVAEGRKAGECGQQTPSRATQRPRLLWTGTTDQLDGVRTYEAPSSNSSYITTSRNNRPVNGIVDLRQSVRSALDRMTQRTLLCLQEDEQAPEGTDYAGASLSKTSCEVAAGTRYARTNSVKSRLPKVRRFQDEFLQELARLDGQRAERLGRLQRRVEELERLVYSVFGENSTREGVVVKKFVISPTRVAEADEWENPRKELPEEVNIIVLKDGITIEGLHVDGTCDSKPIRVQQQEIQRLFDSAVTELSTHRNADTSSFENGSRWRPTNHDHVLDRQDNAFHNHFLDEEEVEEEEEMSLEVDFLPPPPAEWRT